jgi:hypothetical protein
MLFPSESLQQSRDEIVSKLSTGAMEPAAAFEKLLALDPLDRTGLFEYALILAEARDFAAAERVCRQGLEAHPCDYRFYVQLSGFLTAQNKDLSIAAGLMEMGLLKLLSNPDTVEEAERLRRKGKFPSAKNPFVNDGSLEVLLDEMALQREKEPDSTGEALRPLRLLHALEEALGNELERELVEGILDEGTACRPLLIGVLRGLAEGYLQDGGELIAEAALALLGEIGDPVSIPAIVDFAVRDDKSLSDIASWAMLRIAEKDPVGTVAAVKAFDRSYTGSERACLAETVAAMKDTPGRTEALLALTEKLAAVPEGERSDTFVVVSAALLSISGEAAPPVIRKALAAAKDLPVETAKDIDDLLRAYAADPSAFVIPPEESVPSVFDICGADRLQDEEDEEGHVHGPGCDHDHDHHHPAAGQTPVTGRNDPCWCGSGKKYKKCHLAEDEAARIKAAQPE